MILTAFTSTMARTLGSCTTAILAVVVWCVLVIFWKVRMMLYVLGPAIGQLINDQIIYNLFFSPLRNIPGPFFAKITTKWLTINECLGNRSLLVHRAHEKYGPVIRLAPNELSFSDPSCIQELYMNHSKFPKSPRYEGFQSTTTATFDMTDREE